MVLFAVLVYIRHEHLYPMFAPADTIYEPHLWAGEYTYGGVDAPQRQGKDRLVGNEGVIVFKRVVYGGAGGDMGEEEEEDGSDWETYASGDGSGSGYDSGDEGSEDEGMRIGMGYESPGEMF